MKLVKLMKLMKLQIDQTETGHALKPAAPAGTKKISPNHRPHFLQPQCSKYNPHIL